jgi:uncharacterized membrane protein YcfT
VSAVQLTSRSVQPRFAWVDAAKGLCMVLVVLMHVSLWFESEINGGSPGAWWLFSEILAPLRMPLFFFLSGFLVHSAMSRPLESSRPKTIGLYVIYSFWTLAFLLRLFVPLARGDGDAPSAQGLIISILLPTSFWYLWALPVFFLTAWGVNRWLRSRAPWVLVPLAILSAASPLIDQATVGVLVDPMDSLKLGSVASNMVWFFAGLYLRPHWISNIAAARVWKFVAAIAVYAALFCIAYGIGELAWAKVVLAPVALWCAAQGLGLLNMNSPVLRVLRVVGEMTLPVYVFHIFAVSALSAGVKVLGLSSVLTDQALISGLILPPVLAVGILATSRILGRWVLASRFHWLLLPSGWFMARKRPET